MKNLSKEKRDRLILILVGAVVIGAAAYHFIINSQRASLFDLARRKVEEEARVSNAQRLTSTTVQVQEKLEAATTRLRSIESTMASGDMYSWIILTMRTFKESGGYKVDLPQFSKEIATEVGMLAKFPYRASAFHVRGTAYFHDFGRFLADFENAFPYLRIQNIELEQTTGSNASMSEDPEKLAFKMEIVALVNPNNF